MTAVKTSKARLEMLGRVAHLLREAGYTSLDAQAKALGLPRSTTHTIIRCQHKVGRLSKHVLDKMLSNPELPERVRAILQEYASSSEREIAAAMKRGRSSRVA